MSIRKHQVSWVHTFQNQNICLLAASPSTMSYFTYIWMFGCCDFCYQSTKGMLCLPASVHFPLWSAELRTVHSGFVKKKVHILNACICLKYVSNNRLLSIAFWWNLTISVCGVFFKLSKSCKRFWTQESSDFGTEHNQNISWKCFKRKTSVCDF